ncbi:hypothetical protein PPERSA_05823 [Pseudocohnilembus persalinus]|uniref:Uncharacterized protein n=1 Tax=Pseudocohnilembus persalinus TaxID=266149 RepID=A0A0V0QGM0_PSEPJ|nr:hypothetical protein PPERSA_05823 [Pseudocohnilembus persalinus]|eukprot:KRX01237.1 hypothetical protein PPERSA_05823 [Pseudocohnilembus persalinus]
MRRNHSTQNFREKNKLIDSRSIKQIQNSIMEDIIDLQQSQNKVDGTFVTIQRNTNNKKIVTSDSLKQQYLAKLTPHPLEGFKVGKQRFKSELYSQRENLDKQQQLTQKALTYDGDDMYQFEKQLISLKQQAKKFRYQLQSDREQNIKRRNKQAFIEYQQDQQQKDEFLKNLQKYL